MAITTRDALIAASSNGVSFVYRTAAGTAINSNPTSNQADGQTYWLYSNRPAAASAPTTPAVCTSATQGALPLPTATGANTWHLGSVGFLSTLATPIMLLDRLAHVRVPNTNINTVQTLSPNLTRPARSVTATNVMCLMENVGTTAMAQPGAITLVYTNSDGVQRSADITTQYFGLGFCNNLTYANGDRGIASVQSLKLDSSTKWSGTNINIVLARAVAVLIPPAANSGGQAGYLDLGAGSLGADPCLYMASLGNGTVQPNLQATIRMIQG